MNELKTLPRSSRTLLNATVGVPPCRSGSVGLKRQSMFRSATSEGSTVEDRTPVVTFRLMSATAANSTSIRFPDEPVPATRSLSLSRSPPPVGSSKSRSKTPANTEGSLASSSTRTSRKPRRPVAARSGTVASKKTRSSRWDEVSTYRQSARLTPNPRSSSKPASRATSPSTSRPSAGKPMSKSRSPLSRREDSTRLMLNWT